MKLGKYIPKPIQRLVAGVICFLMLYSHLEHQESIQGLKEVLAQKESDREVLQASVQHLEKDQGEEASKEVWQTMDEQIPTYSHEAYGMERLMAVSQLFGGSIQSMRKGEKLADEALDVQGIEGRVYILNISGEAAQVQSFIQHIGKEADIELIEIAVQRVEKGVEARLQLQVYSRLQEEWDL